MSRQSGRLSVVGTGINAGGQLTVETTHLVRAADQVLAVVSGLMLEQLRDINPRVVSLHDCYAVGRRRDDSYAAMLERILAPLDRGAHVCAVFYGHPGVFVWPGHEAVRRARAAGHEATMYPGVSAEDCLFADLGVDPAVHGCQAYEATDFLLHARRIDPTAVLVLWQPAALGDTTRSRFTTDPHWVAVLAEVLMEHYPAGHPVVVYEAASFPLQPPRVERLALADLHRAKFTEVSTLYLAPVAPPQPSPERLRRLGIRADEVVPGAYQLFRCEPGR
ncbi:MAG: SAM-dependent methyltransferase [Lysobacteraceae bacterium]